MPKNKERITLKNGKRLPLSRRVKRRIALFIFLVVAVMMATLYVSSQLRPLVLQIADGQISDIVTKRVNESISEVMSSGKFDYSSLVTLQKDADGNITALTANMANINMLQLDITNLVIEKLGDIPATTISVPIGNVVGGALFSGRGPKMPVEVISITNVTANFENDFSAAGINQTRHQIILVVDVTLKLLVSGHSDTSIVSTKMSIAETIIVGKVPNYYANFS